MSSSTETLFDVLINRLLNCEYFPHKHGSRPACGIRQDAVMRRKHPLTCSRISPKHCHINFRTRASLFRRRMCAYYVGRIFVLIIRDARQVVSRIKTDGTVVDWWMSTILIIRKSTETRDISDIGIINVMSVTLFVNMSINLCGDNFSFSHHCGSSMQGQNCKSRCCSWNSKQNLYG